VLQRGAQVAARATIESSYERGSAPRGAANIVPSSVPASSLRRGSGRCPFGAGAVTANATPIELVATAWRRDKHRVVPSRVAPLPAHFRHRPRDHRRMRAGRAYPAGRHQCVYRRWFSCATCTALHRDAEVASARRHGQRHRCDSDCPADALTQRQLV